MKQASLEASGLDIEPKVIWELFAPFITGEDENAWQQEVARRRRKLLRRAVSRLVGGEGRDKKTVMAEYDPAWRATDYGIYDPARRPAKGTPWAWRGRAVFASDVGGTRFRQLLLCRVIERWKPKSVLEVGCGNGINLILLSGRFPEITFTGVELTSGGHEAAKRFQEQARLPESIQAFAPLQTEDPEAFKRIDFVQGDASNLPFSTGSFDLVYSVLAVEQMEQIRAQALGEIARVAGKVVAMIEPFHDVNDGFWSRLYIYRRNYFRGSLDDLQGYGLTPEFATHDFPQEAFLKACLVVAKKN